MSYGEATYGTSEWGDAYELGAARLLYMIRMSPRFRAFADLIDARWSRIYGTIDRIIAGFDLDSAEGAQLDVIGAWLGLEREGMLDEKYRRALRVQRRILASSSGTAPSIIAVFTDWTGAAPTHYRNAGLGYFEIAGEVAPDDEYLLGRFVRAVAPGGSALAILATADATPGAVLRCDCESNPVTNPGRLDCESSPVTGAATLAYEI